MSFGWRGDDIVRIPENARVEHLASEQDDAGCFCLVVNGDVGSEIRFAQCPPWLPKFLMSLSEVGFPTLTVQDWLIVLGTSRPIFHSILNGLLQSGFVVRPHRGVAPAVVHRRAPATLRVALG